MSSLGNVHLYSVAVRSATHSQRHALLLVLSASARLAFSFLRCVFRPRPESPALGKYGQSFELPS